MDDVALPADPGLALTPAQAVVLADPTAAVDVDAAAQWMAQARELVLAALEEARSQ